MNIYGRTQVQMLVKVTFFYVINLWGSHLWGILQPIQGFEGTCTLFEPSLKYFLIIEKPQFV